MYIDKFKKIVIKVGSSILVDEKGKPKKKWLQEFAKDIKHLIKKRKKIVIVSSGAIAMGCQYLNIKKNGLKIDKSQAVASIGQIELMNFYKKTFDENNIKISQILLTLDDTERRRRSINARRTIDNLLAMGIIPIVNENDVVATEELDLNFGDNDLLAVYLATLIGADQLFLLTVAPGLLKEESTKKGNHSIVVEQVKELTEEILRHCLPITSAGGKGGMESKARSAGMAMSFGIDTYILNGKSPPSMIARCRSSSALPI